MASDALSDTLNPASLIPSQLIDPSIIQGYSLSESTWFQIAEHLSRPPPEASSSSSTQQQHPGEEVEENVPKNKIRRLKAEEREKNRPGLSALLPDEIIVEPPHDPDETVPIPS